MYKGRVPEITKWSDMWREVICKYLIPVFDWGLGVGTWGSLLFTQVNVFSTKSFEGDKAVTIVVASKRSYVACPPLKSLPQCFDGESDQSSPGQD